MLDPDAYKKETSEKATEVTRSWYVFLWCWNGIELQTIETVAIQYQLSIYFFHFIEVLD